MINKQISIRRLSVALVLLLIVVMAVATVSGAWVLQKNYRTAEGRFESEAKETLNLAAIAIRNQIRFFSNVLELIAKNPKVSDLAEFGDVADAMVWSQTLAGMLPGTLGTALVQPNGMVIGNPISQRVGPRCETDLKHFANGEHIEYPPVHRFVTGLEHFDLMAPIPNPSGDNTGVLFVSFRLSVLQTLLDDMAKEDQRFKLSDPSGYILAETPPLTIDKKLQTFSTEVPETDWRLSLEIPHSNALRFYAPLILGDLVALGLVTLFIYLSVQRVMGLFQSDIQRIHTALVDVHNGVFVPSKEPSRVAETDQLLPDIEVLAHQLQEKQHQLALESINDPLTGLYNRRYFDLMLSHDYEQSTRQDPAFLIVIDLNDFKYVNDKFGHPTGDTILKHVSGFLKRKVRISDVVARLGGDEFAIILHNISPEFSTSWLAQALSCFDNKVNTELQKVCNEVSCTLSAGIAPISKDIFPSPEAVIQAADLAMYRAKQSSNATGSRFEIQTKNEQPRVATA